MITLISSHPSSRLEPLSLNKVAVSCWSLSQLLISSHFTVIQPSCWIFFMFKMYLYTVENHQWVFSRAVDGSSFNIPV